MRHISRTRRVDLDWQFDSINLWRANRFFHVNTNQQIADVLTKGSFSKKQWTQLTHLFGWFNVASNTFLLPFFGTFILSRQKHVKAARRDAE